MNLPNENRLLSNDSECQYGSPPGSPLTNFTTLVTYRASDNSLNEVSPNVIGGDNSYLNDTTDIYLLSEENSATQEEELRLLLRSWSQEYLAEYFIGNIGQSNFNNICLY